MAENKNFQYKRFPEIDFIKGIAVIWIVMFHIFRDFSEIFVGKNGGDGLSFSHLILSGALGVDLFVICSGFLLANSYEKDNHKPELFDKFFIKRIKRLVPLYYTAILWVLLLDYLIGMENFQLNIFSILLHMIGLHTFTKYMFELQSAWWFMGMIIQLYILSPFIYNIINYYNKFYIFLLFALLTVAARFIEFANINTNYSLFAFLPTFAAGMLWYEYSVSEKRIALKKIEIAYCATSMIFFLIVMHHDISVFSFLFGLARPIVSTGIFLLLIGCYKGVNKICNPIAIVISLFGINSYAIYLFHRPLIFKYITVVSLKMHNIITVSVFLLIMLAVGFILTQLEKKIFLYSGGRDV